MLKELKLILWTSLNMKQIMRTKNLQFAQIRNFATNFPFLGGQFKAISHLSVVFYARTFPLYRKCVVPLFSNHYSSITIHNEFFSHWGHFIIIPSSISQMGIFF